MHYTCSILECTAPYLRLLIRKRRDWQKCWGCFRMVERFTAGETFCILSIRKSLSLVLCLRNAFDTVPTTHWLCSHAVSIASLSPTSRTPTLARPPHWPVRLGPSCVLMNIGGGRFWSNHLPGPRTHSGPVSSHSLTEYNDDPLPVKYRGRERVFGME